MDSLDGRIGLRAVVDSARRYGRLARRGGLPRPNLMLTGRSVRPTFDIFETVVTSRRLSGRSLLLFVVRVMANEGILGVSPEEFVSERVRISRLGACVGNGAMAPGARLGAGGRVVDGGHASAGAGVRAATSRRRP